MLIKVFPHGRGNGGASIEYLLRRDYHGRKESPPKVVRGDPLITRNLIDSIDREWKYTSGVVSWSGEDTVTENQQNEVIEDFEEIAFAGLEPDQFNILWVRHSHVNRCELHFVIPRLELSTGNAFNAFPPDWQKDFDPLRDYENIKHGWTRPDDPERARMFTPSSADIIESRLTRWGQNPTKKEKDRTRDLINNYIQRRIENGLITNRPDIITSLREIGLEINRESKSFITIKDPETNEKIRLKGGIYNADWKAEKPQRQTSTKPERRTTEDRRAVQQELADLEQKITGIIRKRTTYNRKRYQDKSRTNDSELKPALSEHEHSLRQTLDIHNPTRDSSSTGNNDRLLGTSESSDLQDHNKPEHPRPAGDQNKSSQPDPLPLRKQNLWNLPDEGRERQIHSTPEKYHNRNKLELQKTPVTQTDKEISTNNKIPLSISESIFNNPSTGEKKDGKDRTRNNRNGNHHLNRERHRRLEGIRESQNFRFAESIQRSIESITRIKQLTRKITDYITRIKHNLSSPRKTIAPKQSKNSQGHSR